MFNLSVPFSFVNSAEFHGEILYIPLIDKSSRLQYNVTALTH